MSVEAAIIIEREEQESFPQVVAHEVDVITGEYGRNIAEETARISGQIRHSIPAGDVRKGIQGRHRGWSAIDDVRYVKLMSALRGEMKRLDPKDSDYKAIHRLVHMGKLQVENIYDPVVGKQEWRIIDSDSGRIVPKISEINRVLEFFYEGNSRPGARTLMGLCNRHYCGIGKHHADEFIAKQDKGTRRHAVLFKKPVKKAATRPMQQVQIDIIDAEEVDYGPKTYAHIIMVQCLFSRFVFARALAYRERGLITRHLMDIFSTFGPPESYQTYTGGSCVDSSMPDVAQLFHVEIHCYGRNGLGAHTTNDCYSLRKRCLEKSQDVFGSPLHWVEILPAVVMERNMKLHSAFDLTMSPFEVMFGRQPWTGDGQPPWIVSKPIPMTLYNEFDEPSVSGSQFVTEGLLENETVEEEILGDMGVGEEDTYWKRSLCVARLRPHIQSQISTRTSASEKQQNKNSTNTKLTEFLIGDKVYVRSPYGTLDNNNQRYVKGTIITISNNYQWPYQVQFDHLLPDGMRRAEWVGYGDITACTKQLETIRTNGVTNGKCDHICQCDDIECRRVRSTSCIYNMHRHCCRNRKNTCQVHDKRTFPPNRRKSKSHFESEQLELDESSVSVEPNATETSSPSIDVSNLRRSGRTRKRKIILDAEEMEKKKKVKTNDNQDDNQIVIMASIDGDIDVTG